MRQATATHQEDGLNRWGQRGVIQCNSFFKLKVGGVAHATEDESRTDFFAEVDRQPVKLYSFHGIFIRLKYRLHNGQPFVRTKESLLGAVDAYCHINLIEKCRGTLHDIDMRIGNRVERSGEYSYSHGLSFSSKIMYCRLNGKS